MGPSSSSVSLSGALLWGFLGLLSSMAPAPDFAWAQEATSASARTPAGRIQPDEGQEAAAREDPGQEEPQCDIPHHGGFVRSPLTDRPGDYRMNMRFPTFSCPGGILIMADSAEIYEATGYTRLFGNVLFRDEDKHLRANEAQYFENERRLEASGNVVLTDQTEGSVIRGDHMRLLRAGPQRPEDQLTVTGRRPHATLYPATPPEAEELPPDTSAQEGAEESPDTLAPPQDSAAVLPPDPGAGARDTTGALPDSASAALPDSIPAAADSAVAVLPDSAQAALPDLMAAQADSSAAQADSSAAQAPPAEPEPPEERIPYEIDARNIYLEGSRYFRASGSVEITRNAPPDSLTALADSVEFDQENGFLLLDREARVTTADTDLEGETIRLEIVQDEVREIFADGEAVLVGEDLRLLAPQISLFFTEGLMERLVAVRDAEADSLARMADSLAGEEPGTPAPPAVQSPTLVEGALVLPVHPVAAALGLTEFPVRPYALAQDFLLQGDSLEVHAPGEVLNQVKAMGRARGESTGADSLNTPETSELLMKDWLEGDTVVAIFQEEDDSLSAVEDPSPDPEEDPVFREGQEAQADSTGSEYRLERLVAQGNARSLYRMAASDSTVAEPAAHYVMGNTITILLTQGEVERMEVTGATRGIHIEPGAGRGGGEGSGGGEPSPPGRPGGGPGAMVPPSRSGAGGRR